MNNMQRYLIFGGTGSLGKALIKRFAKPGSQVTVCSRDESKHWFIKNDFKNPNVQFYVGDVRDYERCNEIIKNVNPHIIIIAAALKHVDVCELSPNESLKTNVIGTQNVIEAARNNISEHSCLHTVLFVSTDKACAPVNTYGVCKALSERLVTSISGQKHQDCVINQGFEGDANFNVPNKIRFIAVRYGNVLESRGSIIPLFKHQALHSKTFTVTDERMTRFVMTLEDSVNLIEAALRRNQDNSQLRPSVSDGANCGDIWIPKLKSMKIIDLARIFQKRHCPKHQIDVVGIRPGEKIHESLICNAEVIKTYEHPNGEHYVIRPSWCSSTFNSKMKEYTSAENNMSCDELEIYLDKLSMLDLEIDNQLKAGI